jgi:hypothetical protein
MFSQDFIERREQERRSKTAIAIAHHFAECDRRQNERRQNDKAIIVDWIARFNKVQSHIQEKKNYG